MLQFPARAKGGFAGSFIRSTGVSQDRLVIESLPSGSVSQGIPGVDLTQSTSWHREENIAVAFHGDIFNAQEICRDLSLPSDTPRGKMLVAGWRRWSTALLTRLDGVFALAVGTAESVLLYRDPSALGTLYYDTGRSGRVTFATHLDVLLRKAGGARRIAARSLHEYLRFLDIAAPNTLWNDVAVVEAGRPIRWTERGMEVLEIPKVERATMQPDSFDEAVQTLDEHLQRSVSSRLAGAVRPAAFLSGGIDSALICSLSALGRTDLTAVTVGFASTSHDEAPIAAGIASHLGVSHKVLRFSQDDLRDAFERLIGSLEQPMADPATLATVLAFEYCARRFDVVLDGTGADEAVGAMPARHVRLAVEYASRIPPSLRRGLTNVVKGVPRLSNYAPIISFECPADTMIRWKGFTRFEVGALCGEAVSFAHTQFYRTFDRFERSAHYERYSALLNAMPCDRLSQATLLTGLRPRYPFTELHTDRFLRGLCIDYRFLPGVPKRILRALLGRYVPTKLWDVPKHGFDFPLNEFLIADNYSLVRQYLDQDRWRQTGLLAPDLVLDVGQRYVAGDRRLCFRVWALVVLGAWLERHGTLR